MGAVLTLRIAYYLLSIGYLSRNINSSLCGSFKYKCGYNTGSIYNGLNVSDNEVTEKDEAEDADC